MKPISILFIFLFICPFFLANGQERTLNFPKKTEYVAHMPHRDSLWIFLLAGQSNMAGRGFVEPQDTVSNQRILTINETGQWIYAKEPLHFYEPKLAGLDCGLSFGREVLKSVPQHISIALIPCAVGGSAIEQWLNDDVFRGVQLMSNFKDKVAMSKKHGTIKGILWHQGESNATVERIPEYPNNLRKLIPQFRNIVGHDHLPMVIGQLGQYAEPKEKQQRWNAINKAIREVVAEFPHVNTISSGGLTEKGDKVHFDGPSQRKMGKRFAKAFMKLEK